MRDIYSLQQLEDIREAYRADESCVFVRSCEMGARSAMLNLSIDAVVRDGLNIAHAFGDEDELRNFKYAFALYLDGGRDRIWEGDSWISVQGGPTIYFYPGSKIPTPPCRVELSYVHGYSGGAWLHHPLTWKSLWGEHATIFGFTTASYSAWAPPDLVNKKGLGEKVRFIGDKTNYFPPCSTYLHNQGAQNPEPDKAQTPDAGEILNIPEPPKE